METWMDVSPGGYSRRDDLLDEYRYAFRNDAGLQTRVDAAAEGNGDKDAERRDGYSSQYRKNQRARSAGQNAEEITEALSTPLDAESKDTESKSA